jgi:PAS domain S-box-containing protein
MSVLPLGGARVDEALWSALLRQSGFGVAVCDADGLLVALNPTLESMLGASYQRAMPASWTGLYHLYDEHGEPLATEDAPLLQALRGEQVVDRLISARPQDSSPRHLRCNGARLYDGLGRSAGAVLFVADVTAEVTQREQLEELRERLVETVNHELRTPVSLVQGHAELLDDLRAELPRSTVVHLDAINRGLARVTDVLNVIRELANRSAPQADGEGGRPPR